MKRLSFLKPFIFEAMKRHKLFTKKQSSDVATLPFIQTDIRPMGVCQGTKGCVGTIDYF